MARVDNKQAHQARYAMLSAGKDERTAAFDMVGGGDYELVGFIENLLLNEYAPVPQNGLLVDIGCGPGRLARYLTERRDMRYLGTDVVGELLVVARNECERSDWTFVEVDNFELPADSGIADVVVCFSVFTNIYPEQAFLLARDAFRVLKPGGLFLTTFFDIDFAGHQRVFCDLVEHQHRRIDPLVFLDRSFLRFFAEKLGFIEKTYLTPGEATATVQPAMKLRDGRDVAVGKLGIGQALCVLQKPAG